MLKRAKRGYAPPVKPLVAVPPFFGRSLEVEKDCTLSLETILFGDFDRYLPQLIVGLSSLGYSGLGSLRPYGFNRFDVESGVCAFSGRAILREGVLYPGSLQSIGVSDIQPIESAQVSVGFRTPFTGSVFPPNLDELIELTRRRLIGFVNEYGDGANVPAFSCKGEIARSSVHYHKLERRSTRSEKKFFKGYTGLVDYKIEEADAVSRWLLGVAFVLGCGPDSSFGCGFLQDLTKPKQGTTPRNNGTKEVQLRGP